MEERTAVGARPDPSPERSGNTYPATGLMLAHTRVQRSALVVVGVPLAVILVLTFRPWSAGSTQATAAPPEGAGQVPFGYQGQATDSYSPTPTGYASPSSASAFSYVSPTNSTSIFGEPDSPTPASSPSDSASADPASIVRAYYADIGNRDFQGAWTLGGDNLGQSYASFAAGFSGTANDILDVLGVSGDVVSVSLVSQQSDGSSQTYEGTYTVLDGVITSADLQPAN